MNATRKYTAEQIQYRKNLFESKPRVQKVATIIPQSVQEPETLPETYYMKNCIYNLEQYEKGLLDESEFNVLNIGAV